MCLQRLLVGSALSLLCLGAPAADPSLSLDLSLPREDMAATPDFILDENQHSSPDTRLYVTQMRRLINDTLATRPLIDHYGRRVCADMEIEYLIVIDHNGKVVDVRLRREDTLAASGQLSALRQALFQAIRSISPLPPFPATSMLSYHLIGLPSKLGTRCSDARPVAGRHTEAYRVDEIVVREIHASPSYGR